jgi:rfaE bifunctional protein kinase chain/domain
LNATRFQAIARQYARLRIAVVGDICLDRYLEIDPARQETSIETGRPVHNVVQVRSQPGAAGTILNNLVALGVAEILPVGFCGVDGEGFELRRALAARPGVRLDYFCETETRRTFTYCKPLLIQPGQEPVELDRLDSKNWTPTPPELQRRLIQAVEHLASRVDAIILMDQVDQAETGVITARLLETIRQITAKHPALLILADSRRSLRDWPPVCLKMNAQELAGLIGHRPPLSFEQIREAAGELARKNRRTVFVTLSEQGILAAEGEGGGATCHVPSLPLRGPIDIVGAGDAVTANLTCAQAAGASAAEAIAIANAAASVVIHQLGTTGTASPGDIAALLPG